MKKHHLLAAGAACLALAAVAAPAAAQSIDYGSLEQMFNEPVTTSATGSPLRASQAPVDMDIITAADIKRSGATDLPTILSRVAGVDIQTWGAGYSDLSVRGYDSGMSPRLLVLVNGRQVYLDFYGYTAWSAIPVRLEEIRQVEVVKGPNAALFGFNAVSGVINIVTYNPKLDDKGFVTGRVGSNGYKEMSGGETIKLGNRFSARATVGASRQNEFANPTNVVSSGPLINHVERLTANVDTVTQLADKLELRVEAGWTHDMENDINSVFSYFPTKYLATDVKGSLAWDSPIGLLQVSDYENRVSAKFGGGPLNNKVNVAQVQDLFKLGAKHTFRLAYEHRKTSMGAGAEGRIGYTVNSGSAMWNWQALKTVSITAAARYDDLSLSRTGAFPAGVPGSNSLWDRSITLPSYNAGAVWNVTEKDAIRVTYARGAQIPSLLDFGGLEEFIGPGMLLIGNPQLEPTIVTNYGVSYDRALPEIGGSASIRAFYQKSKNIKGQPDFLHPDAFFPLVVFTYANVSDSDMRGVEATAKGAYKNGVRWNANYTYTDVHDDPRAGYFMTSRMTAFAVTTPKHRANLNVGWDNADWSVDGFVRYQSATELYAMGLTGVTQHIGGYATLAGRVARNFKDGVSIAVSGQNLTNDQQTQTTGLPVERRVFVTLAKTW